MNKKPTGSNEVSGRKCDYCESMDAYPLTDRGGDVIAVVCESDYERGIDKSINRSESR